MKMPTIRIHNCNSINEGTFSIEPHCLNIKYACNGIGKTTCATALKCTIEHDEKNLKQLTPFAHAEDEELSPQVEGTNEFRNVSIFNEDYIDQYVFRQESEGEVLKNSFEVFIKDAEYQQNEQEIKNIISNLQATFFNNENLIHLIEDVDAFLVNYGKQTKTGAMSAASPLGKFAKKGNLIENIPPELSDFTVFIKGENNVTWLKWQGEAVQFLEKLTICPFCARPLEESTKEKIQELSSSYDQKVVQHINNIFELCNDLKQYLSNDAQEKIQSLINSPTGFNEEQMTFIKKLQGETMVLGGKLRSLKNIGFDLSNYQQENLAEVLASKKIDLSLFPCFNSEFTQSQILPLNTELDRLIEQANILFGKIRRHQHQIVQSIEKYCSEINDFLDSAGYSYHVIIKQDEKEHIFKMFLQYKTTGSTVLNPGQHLSYGEKNAFALLLFLYQTLKNNPDLIIFDDPISSFDGNKKFALINLLFMGSGKLSNHTILLLTHDFNTIIDTLKVLKHEIVPAPIGYFLSNEEGILKEQRITPDDIMSCIDIFQHRMESCPNKLNKLIYLRKLCELHRERRLEWHLLSSLFHKREKPTIYENKQHTLMTRSEIEEAQILLKDHLNLNFNYEEELSMINNNAEMISLYHQATNNYEKLHIYRIIKGRNNDNKIIKKFVDETFHVQNDSLFRLDPQRFEIVPKYIIKICDQNIQALEQELTKVSS